MCGGNMWGSIQKLDVDAFLSLLHEFKNIKSYDRLFSFNF